LGEGTGPRNNPLNLIRLGPAEGWFMEDTGAQSIIMQRLQAGETLIWYGTPSPWRAAAPHLGVLAFMTLWTGLAVRGVQNAKDPGVASLFCIAGAATCVWVLKKILDCWRIAYGLTNRHVIVATGYDGPTESYGAAALSDMVRTGDPCWGSIKFNYGRKGEGTGYKAGLHGIRDPARVEALIYETLLGNKKGAGA
jgi:hypothetical protein